MDDWKQRILQTSLRGLEAAQRILARVDRRLEELHLELELRYGIYNLDDLYRMMERNGWKAKGPARRSGNRLVVDVLVMPPAHIDNLVIKLPEVPEPNA